MKSRDEIDKMAAHLTTKGKLLGELLKQEQKAEGAYLTHIQVQQLALILLGNDPDCETCRKALRGGISPSHNGSKHCESGSIASGGSRAHCTCDFCF